MNRQIDDYSIFIGILWKKFGSPTGKAESGTGEEFYRAFKKWKRARKTALMMYFNEEPFFPNLSDLESVEKVLQFKQEISEMGVAYRNFIGLKDFEKIVRHHLHDQIVQLMKPISSTTTENASQEGLVYPASLTDVGAYATLLVKKEKGATLVYLDIDSFKQFNDQVGHEEANIWLHSFIFLMLNLVAGKGKVFRVAGDEFALVLRGNRKDEAMGFADELRRRMAEIVKGHRLTASFGIALMDMRELTPNEGVNEIRDAVHISKIQGKNQFTFCPLSAEQKAILTVRRSRPSS